ncbi:MAG: amidinotransferase, partial [Flavobacterium sp.]
LDLLEDKGFNIENIVDYTSAEEDNIFLEGTGSLVLDRQNHKAYCALSPRADEELVIEYCEDFEYTPVIFEAFQTVCKERKQIYHTNVMMCIGETFAVICADCIDDKKERKMVLQNLKDDGKEVILITEQQLNSFAGNMLQVNGADKSYLVMSASAHASLTKDQISKLEKHTEILSANLDIIEACGGGSARCMMAEIFLLKKQ